MRPVFTCFDYLCSIHAVLHKMVNITFLNYRKYLRKYRMMQLIINWFFVLCFHSFTNVDYWEFLRNIQSHSLFSFFNVKTLWKVESESWTTKESTTPGIPTCTGYIHVNIMNYSVLQMIFRKAYIFKNNKQTNSC